MKIRGTLCHGEGSECTSWGEGGRSGFRLRIRGASFRNRRVDKINRLRNEELLRTK